MALVANNRMTEGVESWFISAYRKPSPSANCYERGGSAGG